MGSPGCQYTRWYVHKACLDRCRISDYNTRLHPRAIIPQLRQSQQIQTNPSVNHFSVLYKQCTVPDRPKPTPAQISLNHRPKPTPAQIIFSTILPNDLDEEQFACLGRGHMQGLFFLPEPCLLSCFRRLHIC